jgi:LuxR family transcriptional regulator, maltose regulon positive regulatory protein
LTLARVRIAQQRRDQTGSALRDMVHLLDQLLEAAEWGGRTDSVIEIHILRALASQTQGARTEALKSLERALQLAVPEGYVRVFIDEGVQLARLLEHGLGTTDWGGASSTSPSVRQYAEQLLEAASAESVEPANVPTPGLQAAVGGVEPLTAREIDVLRLLAAGHSNQAIARELVVAVGTVKRHVNSILGKLQAQSRLQAVARARELDLL